MKQLKKTKGPTVLIVNGKAAAVVQDAAAYQPLLDIAARADPEEGIHRGLKDAKQGKARPAESFSQTSKPLMAYLVNLRSEMVSRVQRGDLELGCISQISSAGSAAG